MNTPIAFVRSLRPRYGHLVLLVLVIILLDQLSKAWFVYTLGSHQAPDFLAFCRQYFTIWGGVDGGGSVVDTFFPFKPPQAVWAPWIFFTLTTNTGAAWSMFSGNSFALSFVSLAMAALLYYVWWRSFRRHPGMTWALGAIIGGALGNFIDRFRLKEVVDFIDCKIPYIGQLFPKLRDPYDFPIFNVADSCAVCGTIALALYLITADLRGALRAARVRRELAAGGSGFTPYRGGIELDEQAAAELKRLTADKPRAAEPFLTTEDPAAATPAVTAPAAGTESQLSSSAPRTSLGLSVHIGRAESRSEEL